MILIALRGMLMGAVFPVTGFVEMPKTASLPQQPTFQQPIQLAPQPQQPATSIPPELIPRLSRDQIAVIRAMQARLGATGRNIGPPITGNIGDLPGSTPQSGTTNPAHHHQIPSGISPEMMRALMQRKQDG